jgi:two-component system, OmpR family, sensor histidine kinase TctE
MSFAARLLEWLLAPLLFLWLLSLGITFLSARETVDTALDDRLNATLAVLHDEWQAQLDAPVPATRAPFPSVALSRLLSVGTDYPVRYLIATATLRPLSGNDDMVSLLREDSERFITYPRPSRDGDGVRPLTLSSTLALSGMNTVLDEEFVRAIRVRFSAGEQGETHFVVVAQSRAKQAALLRSVILHEAIPQTVVLFIAVFLVWYGLAYVVRPMRTLKSHLDARSSEDLAPLPAQLAPVEIEPLITSINALMARLQSSMAAQKRFIANAAHQLRTPLAALRAQSELMQKTTDPRHRDHTVAQLLQTSSRASRLANQLLSLARAESMSTTGQNVPVAVNALCEEIAQDLLPEAIERDIDFAFEPAARDLMVLGDPTLLGEMVRNLVDNAFKYSLRGGQVMISVLAMPTRIVIEDAGAGVPEAERDRVFAPFTRLPKFEDDGVHLVAGIGLGLAIVREVAAAHHARVQIDVSRWGGARFTVTFAEAKNAL